MPRVEIENGASFDCGEDDTILRAGLRAGHALPYACNVGSCGTCRFELKEGEVEHLREDAPAWTERDRKRGRWLGCQARPRSDCRIKVRLDPACEPRDRPMKRAARFVSSERLTHDVTEFRFEIDGPDGFRAGQYALIEMPGVRGGRAYSMSNLPGEGRWDFIIKKTPGGLATGALFEALDPGQTVPIDGPYGTAFLHEDAPRDLLLVGGGSGLSPMISIARAAARSEALAGRRIDFLYGGRAPRDVCGEPMIAELPGWGDRISYTPVLSDESEGWSGRTGFLHDAAREMFGDALREREIYFAGPPKMAEAMQTMLREADVPPAQVHYDEFY